MGFKSVFIPDYSVYSILTKKIEDNAVQFYQSDYKYLNEVFKNRQINSSDVIKMLELNNLIDVLLKFENEIYSEEINKNMKAHGQRHILDVLLYSIIIGESLLNEHDLNLLLIAAKYHDVGRTEENEQEHAYFSSIIARERLSNIISKEDLNIVATAIEFHEIHRKSLNEERVFSLIAIKNGIDSKQLEKTRKISEILKDADALDRTRFVNSARLDNRFLKFDISKRLIKLSANIQETYALEDLKMYDFNQELFKYYTPQEILRKIRKNEFYTQNFEKRNIK